AARSDSELFAFRVPTNAAPNSLITIEAGAVDTAGHTVAASTISVRVAYNQPPTVSVNGLISGQRVAPGATVNVLVQAADVAGPQTIGVKATGVVTATSTQTIAGLTNAVASFLITVPQTAVAGQFLQLDAFAVNVIGLTGTANSILLPITDTTPPTIQILPQN